MYNFTRYLIGSLINLRNSYFFEDLQSHWHALNCFIGLTNVTVPLLIRFRSNIITVLFKKLLQQLHIKRKRVIRTHYLFNLLGSQPFFFKVQCGLQGLMMSQHCCCFNEYSTANSYRSLYRHVVCCVPVSCKANGVRNQFGAWRYSDLLAILYTSSIFRAKAK